MRARLHTDRQRRVTFGSFKPNQGLGIASPPRVAWAARNICRAAGIACRNVACLTHQVGLR